jgi:hypothetical protein
MQLTCSAVWLSERDREPSAMHKSTDATDPMSVYLCASRAVSFVGLQIDRLSENLIAGITLLIWLLPPVPLRYPHPSYSRFWRRSRGVAGRLGSPV